MQIETAHRLQQTVEAIFRERFPDKQEIPPVQAALSRLAFNMMLNGITRPINLSTAAIWTRRIRRRKLYRLPQAHQLEIEEAYPIWLAASRAELLTLTEQDVGYATPDLQTYFCFLHCSQHQLDESLLYLTASPRFSEMWQLWSVLDETLLDQLIAFTQSPHRKARFRAIKPLGFLKAHQAYPHLLLTLNDPLPSVRWQSALALGEIGDGRAAVHLVRMFDDPIREVRWQASEALGTLGPDGVDALIPQLEVDSPEIRWRTRNALHKIGEPAVDPLITALSDASTVVRSHAAYILERFSDERTVLPLIKLLDDPVRDVRLNAARSLGKQNSSAAVAPLIKALKDKEAEVRRWSAYSLGALGDTQAVEPLLALLDDTETWIRVAAIYALGQLKDRRAVLPIINTLDDKEVNEAAALALGELADNRAVAPLIAVLGQCNNALNVLNRFDHDLVVQTLLDAVDPSSKQKYMYVLFALGDTRDPRAFPILQKALNDARPEIRSAVPYRLAFYNDLQTLSVLINALHDEDAHVRSIAVRALSVQHDKSVVPAMLPLLKDADRRVRLFTVSALHELADPIASEALLEVLQDDDDADIRQWAAVALGKLADHRALHVLRAINGCETNRSVRLAAIRAVNQIKERQEGG